MPQQKHKPKYEGHRRNGEIPGSNITELPRGAYRPLPVLNERGLRSFFKKVDQRGPDECWPWKGNMQNYGYGRFWVAYRRWPAHRMAFFLHNGIDPGERLVCHSCDNRICCNPAHLSLGSALDNQSQRWERNLRPVSGENNNRAILTWKSVEEIRAKYATGQYTQRELGYQYGVSRSCIKGVTRRANWSRK